MLRPLRYVKLPVNSEAVAGIPSGVQRSLSGEEERLVGQECDVGAAAQQRFGRKEAGASAARQTCGRQREASPSRLGIAQRDMVGDAAVELVPDLSPACAHVLSESKVISVKEALSELKSMPFSSLEHDHR